MKMFSEIKPPLLDGTCGFLGHLTLSEFQYILR